MKITDEIRAHLKFLETDGRLTPLAVVDDARRPDSPLHEFFEWDSDKAALQYQLDQARTLIRAVKVVITTEFYTVKAPYYVQDPSKDARTQGYTSLQALHADPVQARQALIHECERAAGSLKRARSIAIALDLASSVDAILQHVTGLRTHLTEMAAEEQVRESAAS